MSYAYFVTGTDTDAGKTLVSNALLAAANQRGMRSLGLKPVAAGGTRIDGELMNDDARLLQSTASCPLDYADVNPVALHDAIAPHIAAEREGRSLDVAALAEHCRLQREQSGAELTVAEGAGGWLVPLQRSDTMADLAVAIGWPVILVVAMKLGCLNHALLTAAAIQRAGLPLAGWVATTPSETMQAYAENLATLDRRLHAPRIGNLPFLGDKPAVAQAATCLDLNLLFAGAP
jgi:dethiobiotin synthetase